MSSRNERLQTGITYLGFPGVLQSPQRQSTFMGHFSTAHGLGGLSAPVRAVDQQNRQVHNEKQRDKLGRTECLLGETSTLILWINIVINICFHEKTIKNHWVSPLQLKGPTLAFFATPLDTVSQFWSVSPQQPGGLWELQHHTIAHMTLVLNIGGFLCSLRRCGLPKYPVVRTWCPKMFNSLP